MSDSLGKVSSVVFEQAGAGAAGLVGTAMGGPGLGLALTIGTLSWVAWLRGIATGNDDAVAEQRLEALEDAMGLLGQRVVQLEAQRRAEGLELDRQDVLSKEAILSQFVKDVTGTQTPEKRQAIVNATARQFDPKLVPATRTYWLQILRELPDAHLSFMRLLVAHQPLTFYQQKILATDTVAELPLQRQDVAAYAHIAQQMKEERLRLIYQPGTMADIQIGEQRTHVQTYRLTDSGEILMAFVGSE